MGRRPDSEWCVIYIWLSGVVAAVDDRRRGPKNGASRLMVASSNGAHQILRVDWWNSAPSAASRDVSGPKSDP